MNPSRPSRRAWVGFVICAGAATAMMASANASDDVPLEQPDRAHLEQVLDLRLYREVTSIPSRDGLQPIQVNVDANAMNMIGDAANEPSLAVDPTAPNLMVIGWRQFDTVESSFRQAGWGYSRDGGRSWTFPGVIEPGIFRSDPVLGFDAIGIFYYNSLTVDNNDFTCQVFKSTDGGATWGPPINAWGGDKQWMTIDRTTGIGRGNIYSAWSTAAACCGQNVFTRSALGIPFEGPYAMPEPPRFGTMDVGPNGAVYVAGVQSAPFDPTRFLCARSTNANNATVSPVFDLTAEVDLGGNLRLGAGPNPGGLLGQVNIATDHSAGSTHGNVYMLCSVEPLGDPLDVMFVRSEDGGATWSDPVRINDDPIFNDAWQWFGTIAVAPNGRIDVIWNDTRNDPSATFSELYYSFSADGGKSWAQNEPLTVPFNHFLGYPQQNKLGDYYHMISDNVGAHLAFAATFNGEQDVFYLRIGDYDCNGNSIGDADDLASGGSPDCNGNGIPDECEIAAGTVNDVDRNGVPDSCQCPADFDRDGQIDFDDLTQLLAAWGPCDQCPEDLDFDGTVDFDDFTTLLANWGPCP